MPIPRRLPPLNACRAFEVAASEMSFARAAQRLNVTPAAVSHQVKQLEAWLGHPLFHRGHNKLVLTERGRALLPSIREGLAQVARGAEEVSGEMMAPTLAISVAPNFALRWLIPRLQRFALTQPSVRINVVTATSPLELPREHFDIVIRYLDTTMVADMTGGSAVFDFLFPGDTTPVVSPELLREARVEQPSDLARCNLLHVSAVADDWANWFAGAGVIDIDATKGPRFDSYGMVVEAAVSGWGVALAREDFVAAELGSGRLVTPFEHRLPSWSGWFIITPRQPSPHVRAFQQWLLAEAKSQRGPI